MSGMDRLTAIERHADTERNRILNIALTDLDAIINGHNPDVDTSINNMVWDRLDKLACDIELLAHRRASQAAPAPSDGLREALEAMVQAVCGETGFAEAVRRDSGLSYPWPALDVAEEKARDALTPAPAQEGCE